MINWNPLNNETQLGQVVEQSHQNPCLIFKHSTRCSISTVAKHKLEKNWHFGAETLQPYYIDLLAYRGVSNAVSVLFGVHHESPQVLLIVKGECVYDESHNGINVADIADELKKHGLDGQY